MNRSKYRAIPTAESIGAGARPDGSVTTEPSWTSFVEFTVEGKPIPKGRPRFTKSGHVYTPGQTLTFENAVKRKAAGVMLTRQPFKGPVWVQVEAVMAPPKKLTRDYPSVRPDLDNIVKAVTDALNGICFDDDAQIISLRAWKIYGDRPETRVTVGPVLVPVPQGAA